MIWIILGIIVVLVLIVVGVYNGLVKSRMQTREAWSQIDVQLKRRNDLIPNLIETVKGYAKYEGDTLAKVTDVYKRQLEAYSTFIKKIQYSAAYFSQVRFYQQKETGAFLASYSLTEDTDTVLPSVPHVPAEYVEIVGLAGIIDWRVLLVAIDGDPDKPENYHPIGSLALKNLLEALEPDEYQLLDASQIEIKKLSKERLLELAQLENE